MAEKQNSYQYQKEPEGNGIEGLHLLNKRDITPITEGSGIFGGAAYGYNLKYKTGEYTFRITAGRTLGGFGKGLYFRLFRGEELIAADAVFGNKAEVFACLLYNLLK